MKLILIPQKSEIFLTCNFSKLKEEELISLFTNIRAPLKLKASLISNYIKGVRNFNSLSIMIYAIKIFNYFKNI